MRPEIQRVAAGAAVLALLGTAALVIGDPFAQDPTVEGVEGQWGVECADDTPQEALETSVRTEGGTTYLSIQGTVEYSAERRLEVHAIEDREGEVIVFLAPTDEPLEDRSDMECDRVQSTVDVTVRLTDDYRSIQVVHEGEIVGEYGEVTGDRRVATTVYPRNR